MPDAVYHSALTGAELDAALQQAVVAALNAAPLPLGVKVLSVENLLLRLQAAMSSQMAITQKANKQGEAELEPKQEPTEPEQEE